jgi:hypothetical protein
MCRNIRNLRTIDRLPTDEELHAAALQFVRKVSGYRRPSLANQEVFELATQEIAAATHKMFENLTIRS